MVAIARDGEGTFFGASALVLEGLAPADDLGLQTVRVATDCANTARSQGVSKGLVLGAMVLSSWRSREEWKASL
jgi:hypothetical protein